MRGVSLALVWVVLGVLLGSLVVGVDAGHREPAQAQAQGQEQAYGGSASAVVLGTRVSAGHSRGDQRAGDQHRAQAAHRVVAAEHPHNCPAGTPCCTRSQHAALHPVRTTLPGTVQALSALLPRLPRRAAPDGRVRTGPPSSRGAPDLHVLQVQRT